MKELKAIEILQEMIYAHEATGAGDMLGIAEALAELQQLESKSCVGCENYANPIDDFPYCRKYEKDLSFICDRLGLNDHYTPQKGE